MIANILAALAAVFIIIIMCAFVVALINIIEVHALPPNTTDWDWGGIELWDDNLYEDLEREDEQEHEEESK